MAAADRCQSGAATRNMIWIKGRESFLTWTTRRAGTRSRSFRLRSVTEPSSNAKPPRTGACSAVTDQQGAIEQSPAASYQAFDRALHAGMGRATGGLAPSALMGGFLHWAAHLAASPGKQLELATAAVKGGVRDLAFASCRASGDAADPCQQALPQDHRFRAPEWRH